MTSPGGGNDRISFSVAVEDDGATRTLDKLADGMEDVSRLSAELRKARTAEANAAGQVRVAEARLTELRASGKAKVSQLTAAEEALAKAQRNVGSASDIAGDFQAKLAKAQTSAASGIRKVGRSLGSQMVSESAQEADRGGRKAFMSVGKSFGGGIRAGVVQPLSGLQGVVGGLIAGAGLASFFKTAVLGASDLNETISKTKVIFGQSGDAIVDWSKNSVRSMGLTQNQTLASVAAFGDMFLQLGLTQQQATGMSKQMVQLAADLASFNNADITDVLEAQQAAFRGEFDSLQRYIPNINAARVEQEALAISGKKTTSELTAQDKVLATQAILMKDSARAQGDFSRTSAGTANQMRILQANFQEFLTSIGQEFLPLVNRGVTTLNDFMGPLGQMVHFLGDLPPGVYAGAAALGALVVSTRIASAATGKLSDGMSTLIERGGGFEATGGRISSAAKGFGAALRGAALSVNPVTLALAAGATAIGLYAQKKADAKQRVEDFTHALEADSGALGRNTREVVVHRLEQEGALKAAQVFGLNLGDVTNAALGNQDALTRVNAVLDLYKQQTSEAASAGDTVNVSTYESDAAYTKLRESIGGANTELGKAIDASKRQTEAAGPATTAIKGQGAAAQTAASQVKTLAQNIFELVSANSDAATTDIAFRDSLTRLSESVKSNGTSISLNTVKGRENRGAVLASIDAAQRHAEAVQRQTGSEDKARIAFQNSIPQIREQARRLGLNKKQVDELIGSIARLKPKAVTVTARVSVVDAIAAHIVTPNRTGRNATSNQGGLATGGWVGGFSPSDTSDNVPIMATAEEFMIRRPTARKIRRQAPGFLEALNAGQVDIGGDTAAMRASIGKPLKFAQGGSIPGVQQWIRAQDPKPYIWGGAGPGGFDCSGLVGAAYGMLTGKGGGRGQRYFTTDTIGAAQGLRPGLGTFSVGVTPGRGHMAGQLGSLKFEARSTAAGIIVGPGATSPKSFSRHFFLPQLGGVFGAGDGLTARQKHQIFSLIRPDLARGIMGELSARKFDSGGSLPPGLTMALNNTGRPETVTTGRSMDAVIAELRALRLALADQPVVVNMDSRPVARAVRNQNSRNSSGW